MLLASTKGGFRLLVGKGLGFKLLGHIVGLGFRVYMFRIVRLGLGDLGYESLDVRYQTLERVAPNKLLNPLRV